MSPVWGGASATMSGRRAKAAQKGSNRMKLPLTGGAAATTAPAAGGGVGTGSSISLTGATKAALAIITDVVSALVSVSAAIGVPLLSGTTWKLTMTEPGLTRSTYNHARNSEIRAGDKQSCVLQLRCERQLNV